MTNKEKFLAGQWFSVDDPSTYAFELFSYCTASKCIQNYKNEYECAFKMTATRINCFKTIMGNRLIRFAVKFSEMHFVETEEVDHTFGS
ncbi:hypothetical protein [Nubsella zeaxanthinifaciens]|uniref:hypothetical protein n=1 Tax=Nubsella zeaxanthinifaciens TaxID=392412 RepID=UPI000DE3DE3C|nr:hypothetical protein [Nubsella zeaxanthinifaciens]